MRGEGDFLAVNDEGAEALVVQGLRCGFVRIVPGPDHVEHEEIVPFDEVAIDHLAFEIGKALADQRCGDRLSGKGGQADLSKLVDVSTGAIADRDDLLGHVCRRNGDDALAGLEKGGEAVVGGTDNAADARGHELHHHVPGHGHDIGLTLQRGGQQDHRTGLDQLVDRVEGERFHVFSSLGVLPRR